MLISFEIWRSFLDLIFKCDDLLFNKIAPKYCKNSNIYIMNEYTAHVWKILLISQSFFIGMAYYFCP